MSVKILKDNPAVQRGRGELSRGAGIESLIQATAAKPPAREMEAAIYTRTLKTISEQFLELKPDTVQCF